MHLPSNPYHIFEVYQSTEIYFRGKQLRPAQNCRAYRKQTGRHLSKDGIHMPTTHPSALSFVPALSPAIIAHATAPLPTSPLFSEATQSVDGLNESELPRWEEEPPYTDTKPDSTPQEEQFTCNLFDVMLGRHVRLAKEAKAQRRRHLESGDHVTILTELVSTITERLVRWSDVYDKVEDCLLGGHKDQMAMCWLQWQARDIYVMVRKALELEQGGNPYKNNST